MGSKVKLGGLLLGWKVNSLLFKNVWAVYSCIGISLYSIELELNFHFVSIYGSYLEREVFLNNLCLNFVYRRQILF